MRGRSVEGQITRNGIGYARELDSTQIGAFRGELSDEVRVKIDASACPRNCRQ